MNDTLLYPSLWEYLETYKSQSQWSYHEYYQQDLQDSTTFPASAQDVKNILHYLSDLRDVWRDQSTTLSHIPDEWLTSEWVTEPRYPRMGAFSTAIKRLNRQKMIHAMSVNGGYSEMTYQTIGPDFTLAKHRTSDILISARLDHNAASNKGTTCCAVNISDLLLYAGTPMLAARCISSVLSGTPHCWITREFPPSVSLFGHPNKLDLSDLAGPGFSLAYNSISPATSSANILRNGFLPESPIHPSFVGAIQVPSDAFQQIDNSYSHLEKYAQISAHYSETALKVLHNAAGAVNQPQTLGHCAHHVVFGLLFDDQQIAIVAHISLMPNSTYTTILLDILPFGIEKFQDSNDYDSLLLCRWNVISSLLVLQRHAYQLAQLLNQYFQLPKLEALVSSCHKLHQHLDGSWNLPAGQIQVQIPEEFSTYNE
ncbi:hypothetical protein AX16_008373, partial [Volvariella volvacea WC 439]